MNYRICLFIILSLSLFLFPIAVKSQVPIVKARPILGLRDSMLSEHFKAYSTFQIGTSMLVDIVHNESFDHRVNFVIPGYGNFAIELFENPMQASNYVLSVQSENGITHTPGSMVVKTFRGNLQGGQYLVSLTIDHRFIYGFIQLPKNDMLRIEPLRRYIKSAQADDIIVYRASDVIKSGEWECGVKGHLQKTFPEYDDTEPQRVYVDCHSVQIAFANDWLMYVDYNQDVNDVENHNMGVINDVQSNYDTEFADELIFEVVEVWISTCASCDPWTNSTASEDLLVDFRDWGPSGFTNNHDVADIWTDRDFDGLTVGLAYMEGVCSNFRYLTTQDFSTVGGELRTLLAHELGHNFGANHDAPGSPTIMAPTLVVSNTWSAFSIAEINNYVENINCLGICAIVEEPVADFSADEVTGCEPFTVHFSDESTGPPTSWDWTFPGGNPSSSVEQNPVVIYHDPGVYDVVLEVSNIAGTSTLVRTDYITVFTGPIADFGYDQQDLALIFMNLSEYADSWFWEFGDGSSSTQENPTHTYSEEGEYEVSLSVSNECGEDSYTIIIGVFVPPIADFTYDTDFGCSPLIVHFLNESSDNVQSFEWLFPGGSPASSTEENPAVTYSNPGLYSVTLIVENSVGVDELTVNNLIEVEPVPESDFNFAINGLTVQFTNTSIDADSFLWQFGDGDTSTTSSPNHVYVSGGTYQVMLAAANECGSDVYTDTVILSSAPVADFSISESTGCVPLHVTFTSTSLGEVISYNWSFPGGLPLSSTEPMPTVIYDSSGTYDVQLIAGNAIGFDTLLLEDTVTVYSEVTSGFIADIDGATVDFLNTSTGATVFNWQIDGNSFESEGMTYTFDEDGDYPVQLIASGTCGSDTTVQIIHITIPPIAGFVSDVISGCQPLTVEFFNTSSSNATTFAWVFEGGTPSTSSEENPVVVYAQPGTYDVQLTVWSEFGTDVQVIGDFIAVNPLPVALFTTIQSGLQVEFINNSLDADQSSWMFGDGNTSSEGHPIHLYAEFGTYNITLTTENACGSDTMTLTLSLSTAPVPVFEAEQTNGCAPFEVQFIDVSQNGPLLWEWSFPGGLPDTSNLKNPIVVYIQPGVYSVTLRVSNAAGSQTLVRDEFIRVADLPVAAFSAEPNEGIVTFSNQSLGGDEYFWTFDDGSFDTVPNPIHIYAASGTYSVQLVVTNACSADTTTHDVTVSLTPTDDVNHNIDVTVYPNPNAGAFTLQLEGSDEEFELDVYDLLGKKVLYTRIIPNLSEQQEIRMHDAAPGIYSLILRRDDFRFVTKMVVLSR